MVPASFGCGSAVWARIATLAPPAAARSGFPRPIPRLAPVMKSVLPDRLTVVFRLPRRGPAVYRRLELDAVALGVRDEERAALALRAVARTRSLRGHAARAEPGDQLRLLEGCNGETEVLDVAAWPRRLGAAERAVDPHQVDEAAAGAQLREAELRLLALERTAEHVAVEGEHRRQLLHPQHDVVDALHAERMMRHRRGSLPMPARTYRSSWRRGNRGSAAPPHR